MIKKKTCVQRGFFMERQHVIRINQVGFLPDSSKRFLWTGDTPKSKRFSVQYLEHCVYSEVYSGTVELQSGNDGDSAWVGDFSAVDQPGDYIIEIDGVKSRQFVICKGAYDLCARMMMEYYTWQRCGSELGWAGKCHMDDGYIKETGEHVDLSGGYHQSCDLRKSPGGVSIGVLGMMNYVLREHTPWGNRLFADEARWACDYFTKTIQDSGAMYNTLNAPFGWGGRTFYRSAAPSSAQWCTTSLLALGSLYFKKRDPVLSQKYLEASLRSWNYMTGPERPAELYKHPDPFPRGMDADNFYALCYKDSGADLAYHAVTAANLFRATGDKSYLEVLREKAEKFASLCLDGDAAFCVLANETTQNLVVGAAYSYIPGNLLALCDALELLPAPSAFLREKCRCAADALCAFMKTNVWHHIRPVFGEDDMNAIVGHPAPGRVLPTRREGMTAETPLKTVQNGEEYVCYYDRANQTFQPTTECAFGVFLARCAKIFGNPEYRACAQSVIDQLLGVNPLDSNHVLGIGTNHAPHRAFGQFFPSTPFIPGAVGVGYNTLDVYKGCGSEYDMPCVGMALYLIAHL